MTRQTVLIVEDEQSIADVLSYNIEREGFRVLYERHGRDALARARRDPPDLVVLDLMLPGIDGLQICRELRSDPRTADVRILMLTARSDETDEIVGFNMGADDYVTKPFAVKPLMHRIKALLRRGEDRTDRRDRIALHGLEMDRIQHSVSCDGRELDLTPTEFRLLFTLASQPGRPFSRHDLLDTARGEDANALERTIDVHVRSLRKKLEPRDDLIETVRSVGYRFRRK